MTSLTELAELSREGKKSLGEKVRWLGQNAMIQLRTRRWVMWTLIVVFGLGAVLSLHSWNKGTVAPKSVCECPLKIEPPVQGKAQPTPKAKAKGDK